jgi:hypothetical protein
MQNTLLLQQIVKYTVNISKSVFIYYNFRPWRAIITYKKLYKNTMVYLHDPVTNWDINFTFE